MTAKAQQTAFMLDPRHELHRWAEPHSMTTAVVCGVKLGVGYGTDVVLISDGIRRTFKLCPICWGDQP